MDIFGKLTGTAGAPGLLDKLGAVGDKANTLAGKVSGWVGTAGTAGASAGTTPDAPGPLTTGGSALGALSWPVLAVGCIALLIIGFIAARGR